jgi:hypothetical protein
MPFGATPVWPWISSEPHADDMILPLRSVNEEEIGPQASSIAERARRISARLKRESTQATVFRQPGT